MLLASLQRVYAKTIKPDPEDEKRRRMLERNAFRSRGTRGRGRGGRGGWNRSEDRQEKWTQKKGDKDGMAELKGIRDGQGKEGEQDAMAEFVGLVEEMFGNHEKDPMEEV
jgi:hypothetical protein